MYIVRSRCVGGQQCLLESTIHTRAASIKINFFNIQLLNYSKLCHQGIQLIDKSSIIMQKVATIHMH